MAFLRGNCTPACFQDRNSACWHKDTTINKQLLSGKWVLENKKGYIRLADEDMIIFSSEEEYIKHKNPHVNNRKDTITPIAILKSMGNHND